jgi:CRISPR/Cas system-associated exonuclease Cas4 (RecB family)
MEILSLSSLLSDYISSNSIHKERDPYRLFLSDIGKCSRQVQYRLLQTEKNPTTTQADYNKTIMFSIAEYMESELAKALAMEGLLWGYQGDIDIYDRENWGGRYDLLANYEGKRIIEVKTVHPNAFRYTLDYAAHRYQAWSYHHYLAETEGLTEFPLLVYFDRGGQNTAQEVTVTPQPIVALMDELDAARGEVREEQAVTFDQIPKILKVRAAGKQIRLEPDSRCKYCDYSRLCDPDFGEECWAKRNDNSLPWEPTKKADPARMEAFATTIVEESL